jgi:hypothetical protein
MQRVVTPVGEHGLLDGDERSHTGVVGRAFVAIALVLSLGVWWAHNHQRPMEEGRHPTDRPHLSIGDAQLGGWLWYDGWWYHDIAEHLYGDGQVERFEQGHQSAAAFFPAYPLVIIAVGAVTRDLALAQIVSTFALGLCAALLFARWCRARLRRRPTLLAAGLLLLYPYAWFLYGSGYADALLLASTLTAFLLLEADRPLLAGLAGVVATAARPTGIIVVLGLVAVALERRGTISHDPTSPWRSGWRIHRELADRRDALVLVAHGRIGAFALVQWWAIHDPRAIIHPERGWHQGQGLQTWLKVQLLHDVTRHPITWWSRVVAQALMALVFVIAARGVARRFGWGYGAFALAAAAIPAMTTADFMGTGRYLLGCFPVFAAGGAWLAERRWRPPVVLVPSGLLLLWLTTLFARGYYLS